MNQNTMLNTQQELEQLETEVWNDFIKNLNMVGGNIAFIDSKQKRQLEIGKVYKIHDYRIENTGTTIPLYEWSNTTKFAKIHIDRKLTRMNLSTIINLGVGNFRIEVNHESQRDPATLLAEKYVIQFGDEDLKFK